MEYVFSPPKLARAVLDFVTTHKKTTRAELNAHFKCNGTDKRGAMMTDVIRSLLAYDHLDRYYDNDSETVHFWLKGEPSEFTALPTQVNRNAVDDYIGIEAGIAKERPKPSANDVAPVMKTQGRDFGVKLREGPASAPSVVTYVGGAAPFVPEKKTPARPASLSLPDDKYRGMPYAEVARQTTIDEFILHVASLEDFVTLAKLIEYVGAGKAQYVALRGAVLVNKGWLTRVVSGTDVIYHLPTKELKIELLPPEIQLYSKPKPDPNRIKRAYRRRDTQNEQQVAITPPVSTQAQVQHTDSEPQELQEPTASLDSDLNFVFVRESGDAIEFTLREQLALFKFMKNINPASIYDDLMKR